jgi:Ni,Fe-hydrogenase III small subunit
VDADESSLHSHAAPITGAGPNTARAVPTLEIHALNNIVCDLERFGLRFVASPRHADVLLVTGPVTTNMRYLLLCNMTLS